jgi:lysophospholipase L1-like esterase
MLMEKGCKLVMIGDSITDAGRDQAQGGEGLFEAYGSGYVSLVNALLMTCYPERRIRVVNQGISGHTVRDLAGRWQRDVIEQEPDWVSVMIGINDVWRQFDLPLLKEKQVQLEEYEQTLSDLVASTRPRVKGMVLMTPYFIEANRNDPMRRRMDAYGAVVGRLASEHDAVFVDTQAAMDRYLASYHPSQIAWDRVHPTLTGHMILARAWLDAVGFVWEDAGVE